MWGWQLQQVKKNKSRRLGEETCVVSVMKGYLEGWQGVAGCIRVQTCMVCIVGRGRESQQSLQSCSGLDILLLILALLLLPCRVAAVLLVGHHPHPSRSQPGGQTH